MIRALARLPDLLTALRLALVPLLWAAALAGRSTLVGWGLLLAGLTDAADGFVARRLGSGGTAFGARFDSPAGWTGSSCRPASSGSSPRPRRSSWC